MAEWHLIVYSPAYNVAKAMPELLNRMDKAAVGLAEDNVSLDAFVIVNDGSTDKTRSVIEKEKSLIPFLLLYNMKKNEGPVAAVFDAMEKAAEFAGHQGYPPGRTIMVRMDTDLEHQPEDLEHLVEPIISGKTEAVVGYVPIDERSGLEYMEFNEKAGIEESVPYLGIRIPQFCPGFNAIRLDLFGMIHPELVKAGKIYEREMGAPLLAMDFVALILAKKAGWKPHEVKLLPIQDKWLKKPAPEKMKRYLETHEKTMRFLEREYPKLTG
jgi:glycosyltransferase involved in cell wall biosynthesis